MRRESVGGMDLRAGYANDRQGRLAGQSYTGGVSVGYGCSNGRLATMASVVGGTPPGGSDSIDGPGQGDPQMDPTYQDNDRNEGVSDNQSGRRRGYFGVAFRAALVLIGGSVAIAIKHRLLPEPRSTIWTPIGDAIVRTFPYVGEVVVVVALVVCVWALVLAFTDRAG